MDKVNMRSGGNTDRIPGSRQRRYEHFRRLISLLMGLVLFSSSFLSLSFVTETAVYADEPEDTETYERDIVLNPDRLLRGVNTVSAPTIRLGDRDDGWRVVGYNGNGVAGRTGLMTLIHEDIYSGCTPNSCQDINHWTCSYVETQLKLETDSVDDHLSGIEKAIVVSRNLVSTSGVHGSENYDHDGIWGPSVAVRFWPLSEFEFNQLDSSLRHVSGKWWLRSPGDDDKTLAAVEYGLFWLAVSHWSGVRPGFYMDGSSISFIYNKAGRKGVREIGTDSLKSVSCNPVEKWSLVLLDDTRDFHAERVGSDPVEAGYDVTIKYSGAKTGDNEYVSVILVSAEDPDTPLYYGRIAHDSAENSGGQTVKIPTTLPEGSYILKVYSEQVNPETPGNEERPEGINSPTDLASAFVDIPIDVTDHRYSVTAINTDTRGTATSSVRSATVGSTVSVSATPLSARYVFDHWEVKEGEVTFDDPNSASTTFRMEAGNVIVAAFFREVPLSVTVSHNEGGTARASIASGIHGTRVTLTAIPQDSDHLFDHWEVVSGNVTVTPADKETAYFDIGEENVVIKAHFKRCVYSVSVNVSGNGTAYASPSEAISGTRVLLYATPADTDHPFDHWEVISGGVTIRDVSAAITSFDLGEENAEVKAYFGTRPDTAHDIIVTSGEHGSATASHIWAEAGETITLSVTPDEGYEFDRWDVKSGGVTVSGNSFIMSNEDVEIEAHFKKILPKTAAPVAGTVSGSTVRIGERIAFRTATTGALIYWSYGTGDPEIASANRYRGGVTISGNMAGADGKILIRAVAVKAGYLDSDISEYEYILSSVGKASEDPTVSADAVYAERAGAVDGEGYLKDVIWAAGIPESVTYTGDPITFDIRVYDKNVLLKKGTDYTIKYVNNKIAASANAVKAPAVIITGKGQYADKLTVPFSINKADISDASFGADDMTLAVPKKPVKPAVKLMRDGKAVANRRNAAYTLEYYTLDNKKLTSLKDPGRYRAVFTGRGNFTGVRESDIFIMADTQKPISKAVVSGISRSYAHTLSSDGVSSVAHFPEPVVTYGGETLIRGIHYYLQYQNNEEAGTARVIICGIDPYFGEKAVTFKIKGGNLKKAKFDTKAKVYTGEEIKPAAPTVAGKALTEGVDYDVEYINNIGIGKAKAVYTGRNAYGGVKVTKTFKITPYPLNLGKTDINERVLIETEPEVPYTKGGAKSPVTVTYDGEDLQEGIDYTVQYKFKKATSERDAYYYVIVKGKGNFKGTVNPEAKNFSVLKGELMRYDAVPKDIGALEDLVTVSDRVYLAGKTGSYYFMKPVISDTDGKVLKQGLDYRDLTYTYAVTTELEDGTVKEAGESVGKNDKLRGPGVYITVSAKGMGNYTGEVSATYRVCEKDISKVRFNIGARTYTGYVIEPAWDEIEATVGSGAAAVPFEDFEIVSYGSNTKKGKGTVTVRGTGEYGGMRTISFTISPKTF